MSYLGLQFTCLVAKKIKENEKINFKSMVSEKNQRLSLNKSKGVLVGGSNFIICHIMKMVWPFEKLLGVDWSCLLERWDSKYMRSDMKFGKISIGVEYL